ncbi:plasmid mobilization protein [Frateuria aurantia]
MTEKQNTYGSRPRAKYIKVFLNETEWKQIEEKAASAGLPLSSYLRAAGLNHRVKSVYDLQAVVDLVKVNGDLGRVAGLLKLWLAEKPGYGAQRVEVNQMMVQFRASQADISRLIGRAIK